jgi:GNAT superfamily N-acetyltransferase
MATARSVREDELDELLALYRMLNPDDPELDRDDALAEQWREMLADDSLEVVVVEHDDRLVATCLLSITANLTRNARPFALIENVVTHEAYRGQGFGSRCLEAAVDVADERGCYKVLLLTGTDREWKLEFYENCGFDRGEKTGFVYDLR